MLARSIGRTSTSQWDWFARRRVTLRLQSLADGDMTVRLDQDIGRSAGDFPNPFLGMAIRPCRVSASRSRPCLRPLQGGGSARQTTVLPRGGSRLRRADGVVELSDCIMVGAMGPSPAWAETRRVLLRASHRGTGRRGSGARPVRLRARARPRPFRPRGAQQEIMPLPRAHGCCCWAPTVAEPL
jgi:hypothetical protein